MTVASIPMVSEVARSMPAPAPVVPRQMLPPPTMTASSRSSSWSDRAISPASCSTVDDVDGLVRGRRGERLAGHLQHDALLTAHRFCRRPQSPTTTWANWVTVAPSEQARDGLLLVLDVGLVEQDPLLVPAVQATLDDLRQLRPPACPRCGRSARPSRARRPLRPRAPRHGRCRSDGRRRCGSAMSWASSASPPASATTTALTPRPA